ncbi:MAG: peptidase U32 family protein [Fibrobacterota bacterium]
MYADRRIPELLLPAGSPESFFAAVEAGADAVYAGLKEFNARARAENFTVSELSKMADFLHKSRRRLYVTLNTLIRQDELPALFSVLRDISFSPVDGVIFQDAAVLQICRTYFPGIRLHASTQLTVHNSAGMKFLSENDVSRAVAARELSVSEIRRLASVKDIETEVFVHGAMCYSFSGLCCFTALIDGPSANRGLCSQACRRAYEASGRRAYNFSMKDLSLIDRVPDLCAAGVSSLKVEGRLKNPEFVHLTGRAYRMVLDAAAEGKDMRKTLKSAHELLSRVNQRDLTEGYAAGTKPSGIINYKKPGTVGKQAGKIESVKGSRIEFRTSLPLRAGDRLRKVNLKRDTSAGFVIKSIYRKNAPPRKNAVSGEFIAMNCPHRSFKGEVLYKVTDSTVEVISREKAEARLRNLPDSRIKMDISVFLEEEKLSLLGCFGPFEISKEYPVEVFTARDKELDHELIESGFGSGGGTPFSVVIKNAEIEKGAFIRPSDLKKIRRDFLSEAKKVLDSETFNMEDVFSQINAGTVREADKKTKFIKFSGSRFPEKLSPDADTIYLADLKTLAASDITENAAPHIAAVVPTIIRDRDFFKTSREITGLIAKGIRSFFLDNISHFMIFRDITEKLNLYGGPRLYTLNSSAAEFYHGLGISSFTEAYEDNLDNVAKISEVFPEISFLCHTRFRPELYISAAPPEYTGRIKDLKGREFEILKRGGLTVTVPGKPLDRREEVKKFRNHPGLFFIEEKI